jgi:hypothetical protein
VHVLVFPCVSRFRLSLVITLWARKRIGLAQSADRAGCPGALHDRLVWNLNRIRTRCHAGDDPLSQHMLVRQQFVYGIGLILLKAWMVCGDPLIAQTYTMLMSSFVRQSYM